MSELIKLRQIVNIVIDAWFDCNTIGLSRHLTAIENIGFNREEILKIMRGNKKIHRQAHRKIEKEMANNDQTENKA